MSRRPSRKPLIDTPQSKRSCPTRRTALSKRSWEESSFEKEVFQITSLASLETFEKAKGDLQLWLLGVQQKAAWGLICLTIFKRSRKYLRCAKRTISWPQGNSIKGEPLVWMRCFSTIRHKVRTSSRAFCRLMNGASRKLQKHLENGERLELKKKQVGAEGARTQEKPRSENLEELYAAKG